MRGEWLSGLESELYSLPGVGGGERKELVEEETFSKEGDVGCFLDSISVRQKTKAKKIPDINIQGFHFTHTHEHIRKIQSQQLMNNE